jgi:hypothetical protein
MKVTVKLVCGREESKWFKKSRGKGFLGGR